MPLINCPDCGREISDQAPACVQCGRPMHSNHGGSRPNPGGQQQIPGDRPIEIRDRNRERAIEQQNIGAIAIATGVVCMMFGSAKLSDYPWFDGGLAVFGLFAAILGGVAFMVGRSKV